MTDYNDLPQEIKDNISKEQWQDILQNGVAVEVSHNG